MTTLENFLHDEFDNLRLWFLPTDTPNRYEVKRHPHVAKKLKDTLPLPQTLGPVQEGLQPPLIPRTVL